MSALANNYKRKNLSFAKGKGSFLITSNGKKYLDFVQGIAVNSLGHSNKKLISAINHQSKNFGMFQMPLKYQRRILAKRLVKRFCDL